MLTLFLIIFVISVTIIWSTLSLAPWVPTRNKDLERIKVMANLKNDEVFYELGCGTGRVSRYVSNNTKGQIYGVELSIPLWFYCWLSKIITSNKNIFFKLNNIFNENLSNADVVYIFACPQNMKEKLKQKLIKDLKKGTRIISYVFAIEGWEPSIISKPTNKDLPVYLYII